MSGNANSWREPKALRLERKEKKRKEKKNFGFELICSRNSMVAMVAIKIVGVAHSRVHLSSGGQGGYGQGLMCW